jgi:hypothetical protein
VVVVVAAVRAGSTCCSGCSHCTHTAVTVPAEHWESCTLVAATHGASAVQLLSCFAASGKVFRVGVNCRLRNCRGMTYSGGRL